MAGSAKQRSCFYDHDRRTSNASLFNRPGLFVGLSKNMESDSSGSPKSPLDCRIRSPRSPIWNREKVGLSLISKDECRSSRIVFGSSGSGTALHFHISSPKSVVDHPLAETLAASSKSLPSNYSISDLSKKREKFHLPAIRSSSGSLPVAGGFAASISASEIERSEDYTRIISRGPNPKTTHIFGDCIFEDQSDFAMNDQAEEGGDSIWIVDSSDDRFPFPTDNFMRICFGCKKKLDGENVYVYRGEKAFCSTSCRARVIGTVGDADYNRPTSLSLSMQEEDDEEETVQGP